MIFLCRIQAAVSCVGTFPADALLGYLKRAPFAARKRFERASFVKQVIHCNERTLPFSNEENRFHTPERTPSNQAKQRRWLAMLKV